MKTIHIKRVNSAILAGILAWTLTTGCNDYLDREPMSQYLSSDFYNNEGAIRQGANGCYQRLKMDHTNSSSSNIPLAILWDMYTPFGIERADNSSVGVGNIDMRTNFTPELLWSILYTSVARCNSVLDGAGPFYDQLNDNAKTYLAEIRVLRAHFHIQLMSLWGDVPYFKSSVTDEQLKQVARTPWEEIADDLMTELEEAAAQLPWIATEWGRVDKSVALGLKARVALYAGSWCKFGYGMAGTQNETKAVTYFEYAADAARRVINESGRELAPQYKDLFTREG
ncbi:MAG: RagB/SusD family nutrient uptake outer membrane protein [Bacteroides sp.]|nr:RagB/SusD family nutrient uptake outer membrane protein [Bacteroides sp.]